MILKLWLFDKPRGIAVKPSERTTARSLRSIALGPACTPHVDVFAMPWDEPGSPPMVSNCIHIKTSMLPQSYRPLRYPLETNFLSLTPRTCFPKEVSGNSKLAQICVASNMLPYGEVVQHTLRDGSLHFHPWPGHPRASHSLEPWLLWHP